MNIEYIETLQPRIYDINYGGHLGHVELVNLLHEIRARFLKKYTYSEIEIDGCALFMRTLHIDYLNEAFWNNDLKFQMTLDKDGAKIIFKYVVYNLTQNNITANAEATMVLVNKSTRKISSPDEFFQKLS